MGLSNEVLFIHIVQGAAKLPEVKVEDLKNNLRLESGPPSSGAESFFSPPNLTFGSFVVS